MPRRYNFDNEANRFWSKVARTQNEDECWNWTAHCNNRGYGQFYWRGKPELAHRVAYQITTGEPPGDHEVLHSCDNPACVNPRHLSLGTHQDNMNDMAQKKRAGGHKHGQYGITAKLNEVEVAAIRDRFCIGNITQKQLADEYGVHPSQISRIVAGKRWR